MEISIKWNLCRVCLQEENRVQNNMKDIFTGSVIAKRIYECSGIEMSSSDGLPEKMCQKCLITLKHAWSFRTKCRQSDEYLRKVMEKAKSTTLFAPDKKTTDDPFDMIEEVFEDTEGTEAEEQIGTSFLYSTEILEDCTSQKSASSVNVSNKIDMPKISIKSLPIKNEMKKFSKTTLKPPGEAEKGDNNENDDEMTSRKTNRNINLNIVERKEKVKQEMLTNELNIINHVIDSNNKSTYRVEFINTVKQDNADVDVEDVLKISQSKLSLKSLDKQKQSLKLEVENDNKLKNDTDKEDKTENYYVVVSQEEDDKNEQEFESDDEMTEVPNKKHDDLVERGEEAEFVDVPNDEVAEYVLGDDLVHEDILEYNGDADSQSDYHACDVPSNSEDIMSTDNESGKKADVSNNSNNNNNNNNKKIRGRRERRHLDKKIFPRKVRDTKTTDTLVCETCGNHFTGITSLRTHLRIHRQDKYHECELCSKRFTAACNLTAHMRTHTGEKPYACQFCDRRFSDRSTHIKHERTHTNERPFQCTICLKSFSLSTSLRAHELVHTGEKRHSCLPCKKAFKLPHQLKAHFKTQLHKIIVNEICSNDGEQLSD